MSHSRIDDRSSAQIAAGTIGTVQARVIRESDTGDYWIEEPDGGTGSQYVPLGGGGGGSPVSASATGTQKRHGFLAVGAGSSFALANTSSYYLDTSSTVDTITGAVAASDGETITLFIQLNDSLVAGGNIILDGARGDIITPSFGAIVVLQYVHSLTSWFEKSRSEF